MELAAGCGLDLSEHRPRLAAPANRRAPLLSLPAALAATSGAVLVASALPRPTRGVNTVREVLFFTVPHLLIIRCDVEDTSRTERALHGCSWSGALQSTECRWVRGAV